MEPIRIPRVLLGYNEDGAPMYGPEWSPPERYSACEITETEYIYTVAE